MGITTKCGYYPRNTYIYPRNSDNIHGTWIFPQNADNIHRTWIFPQNAETSTIIFTTRMKQYNLGHNLTPHLYSLLFEKSNLQAQTIYYSSCFPPLTDDTDPLISLLSLLKPSPFLPYLHHLCQNITLTPHSTSLLFN